MNFRQLLQKQADIHGSKPGLIFADKAVSFDELKNRTFALADFLQKQGIGCQDKIAVYLSNTDEAVYVFCGIFSIGASVVPLDFLLIQEEIINFINHSQAKVLIIQPKKNIDLTVIKNLCPSLKVIIVSREKIDNLPFIPEIVSRPVSVPKITYNPNALAAIFYTSGSTGHPKGVMLNYAHLVTPIFSFQEQLNINDQDIFLCGGVPFSHLGGLDYVLAMVYFGLTLILQERFHPLEFLTAIQQHRVSVFCIVPAMYVGILSLKTHANYDLSSLRYAAVFGAPSSPVLLKKFQELCPKAMLINGWGMTETSAPNTFSPLDFSKIASIGKFSFRLQAKIVDDSGGEIKIDQHGELLVKGAGVMAGYYREPELTAQSFTADGWFKTGDIACKDVDGLFYIVGRKKDMLKTAGEIVFTAEVEEKIQAHPAIKEVAVIGTADKLRGEVPKAFISLKDGQTLDSQTLREYLKFHLAGFKIPRYFEFISELPKNRTGKIDKQALKGVKL